MPVNLNVMGPVNDNARVLSASSRGAAVHSKHSEVPHSGKPSHSPQATSLPGSMNIISNVMAHSDVNRGIPGIIQTTTTSPENRQRLVSGIIESCMHGAPAPQGPVSAVMGHDATAYNMGMVHIRGAPSHPGGKMAPEKMVPEHKGKKAKKEMM